MDAVKVNIQVEVSQQRIEDVLCGAFEGGCNYWAITGITKEQREAVGAEYPFEVPTRGGEVEVFDREEPETLLGVLNEENIKTALALMALGENVNGDSKPHYRKHLQNIIDENDDEGTSDVLMQLAVMGDVVFS
jgi:hypothetical protein